MIMFPHVVALALAGAAQDPASPASECPLVDNGCRAKRYEREAAREDEPERRALLFYSAHVAYLDHYQRTGAAVDLCAARRALGKSLAVKGQPEQQRAHFKKSRAELAAIASRDGVRCDSGSKRSSGAASSIEVTSTAATASNEAAASMSTSTPAPVVDRDEPTAPAQEHADDPLMPTTAVVRSPLLAVPATSGADRSPTPARPGRPLVIAGGVTLAAGVVLAGVATYAGVEAADIKEKGFELKGKWDSLDKSMRMDTNDDLTKRWHTMYPLALGTAIAGGVGIVVGAVLLGEGRHRQARFAATQTALVPLPGGLAIRGRF